MGRWRVVPGGVDEGGAGAVACEVYVWARRESGSWRDLVRPARPREEEGEAARNNVVMSAGKRSCPDNICYLLSVISAARRTAAQAGHKAARHAGNNKLTSLDIDCTGAVHIDRNRILFDIRYFAFSFGRWLKVEAFAGTVRLPGVGVAI